MAKFANAEVSYRWIESGSISGRICVPIARGIIRQPAMSDASLGHRVINDDQANQAQMTACMELFRCLQRSFEARSLVLEALRFPTTGFHPD